MAKSQAKGVLERVLTSQEELKKRYGRTAGLDLRVLERFMTPSEISKIVTGYTKHRTSAGGGPRMPTAQEEKWFKEHVDFPSISAYARDVAHQDPGKFRARMHKVAYYHLVVKKIKE